MKIGRFQIDFLKDAVYLAEGGTLFGATARQEWTKYMPPDEHNCVLLPIYCLLVRDSKRTVLIDTGIGRVGQQPYYNQLSVQRPHGNLFDKLKDLQIRPNDVTDVINTHLHQSHCGWNTQFHAGKGTAKISFPKARYWIQKAEWDCAMNPHGLARSYYNAALLAPLHGNRNLCFLHGNTEIGEGLSVELVGGHTGQDQVIVLRDGSSTLVFLGDFIPTTLHVQPGVVAANDLYPTVTYERKTTFLQQASRGKWLLAFQHDPACRVGKLYESGDRWEVECIEKGELEIGWDL